MKKIIKVNNLVKNYGNFEAVKKISFDVIEGSLFAFLGPNGEIGRASCRERV